MIRRNHQFFQFVELYKAVTTDKNSNDEDFDGGMYIGISCSKSSTRTGSDYSS